MGEGYSGHISAAGSLQGIAEPKDHRHNPAYTIYDKNMQALLFARALDNFETFAESGIQSWREHAAYKIPNITFPVIIGRRTNPERQYYQGLLLCPPEPYQALTVNMGVPLLRVKSVIKPEAPLGFHVCSEHLPHTRFFVSITDRTVHEYYKENKDAPFHGAINQLPKNAKQHATVRFVAAVSAEQERQSLEALEAVANDPKVWWKIPARERERLSYEYRFAS